jgi:hypothetical protein
MSEEEPAQRNRFTFDGARSEVRGPLTVPVGGLITSCFCAKECAPASGYFSICFSAALSASGCFMGPHVGPGAGVFSESRPAVVFATQFGSTI